MFQFGHRAGIEVFPLVYSLVTVCHGPRPWLAHQGRARTGYRRRQPSVAARKTGWLAPQSHTLPVRSIPSCSARAGHGRTPTRIAVFWAARPRRCRSRGVPFGT